MNRRDFIKKTMLASAAVGTTEVARATDWLGQASEPSSVPAQENLQGRLIASAPMLQNYAETSIGIAFAVTSMANGFVVIGRQPDLSDGHKVFCGGHRLADISDQVLQVRITGLLPATKYYYRIGADRIEYKGGYSMKNLGTEEDTTIYSFTTAGAKARAHFCVINDTHAKWQPFGLAIEKIAQLAPSCVIWNGDASNVEETMDALKLIYLNPDIERKDYAARTPYLFCPGNHDFRGMANRHLERLWMYRQPEERSTRDWDLGRNFAVRMGEVALIGLDTGEDKLDTNPLFAGIFKMTDYRKAQTEWLREALQHHEIADAPFLVVCCHIPLYDPNPKHNPGDLAPDDKDPRYSPDFAEWQRTCATMWCPLLEQAGAQLIITGHQHTYRYDKPTAGRPWAQIVGGGPEMGEYGGKKRPDKFPTVIEGEVGENILNVSVHNLISGNVQETFTFSPRKHAKAKKR